MFCECKGFLFLIPVCLSPFSVTLCGMGLKGKKAGEWKDVFISCSSSLQIQKENILAEWEKEEGDREEEEEVEIKNSIKTL